MGERTRNDTSRKPRIRSSRVSSRWRSNRLRVKISPKPNLCRTPLLPTPSTLTLTLTPHPTKLHSRLLRRRRGALRLISRCRRRRSTSTKRRRSPQLLHLLRRIIPRILQSHSQIRSLLQRTRRILRRRSSFLLVDIPRPILRRNRIVAFRARRPFHRLSEPTAPARTSTQWWWTPRALFLQTRLARMMRGLLLGILPGQESKRSTRIAVFASSIQRLSSHHPAHSKRPEITARWPAHGRLKVVARGIRRRTRRCGRGCRAVTHRRQERRHKVLARLGVVRINLHGRNVVCVGARVVVGRRWRWGSRLRLLSRRRIRLLSRGRCRL